MWYPHEVTFKVKLAIIQTRVFFTLKRNTDTVGIYGTTLVVKNGNPEVVET